MNRNGCGRKRSLPKSEVGTIPEFTLRPEVHYISLSHDSQNPGLDSNRVHP
jgi:hypothetical protein